MNKQFTFEGKQKTTLIALMVLGLVCMVLTWFAGGQFAHERFWTNFLHNVAFFTGISFLAVFVYACKVLAYSGWHSAFKRVMEAISMFLPYGLVFMLIIIAGNYLGFHHLYHWTDAAAVEADPILKGKASFLNSNFYAIYTILVVGMWIIFAYKFRSLSLQEDEDGEDDNFTAYRRMKKWAAWFLPLGGFTSAGIIWLWIMSIDAHWYSTMFAWYTTASWLVSCVAIIILLLIYLKSKGYYSFVTQEHLHDLGKYLFGFSVFWTYLWFSQYMLIWYANVGEETVYFQDRIREFPVLFYGNLLINFVLPFLVLMRNDTKRKFGTLGFVAVAVLFGHWFDFFNMIKPGSLKAAQHGHGGHDGGHGSEGGHDHHGELLIQQGTEAKAQFMGGGGHEVAEHAAEAGSFFMGFDIPGLLEIGTFLGFGALFLFVVLSALAKAPLYPEFDPYIQESLHHEVEQHAPAEHH